MSALLDALTYGAEALSKPGRAVRGAIAGRPDELLSFLPFSDSLGVTDPSRAVWGRDLLGMAGLGTGSETGDMAAGMGVDLLTDPLLYFGGGLARGAMSGLKGTRALGVGAGEDVGAAIGRLARPAASEATTATDDLLRQAERFHPPPSLADEARFLDEAWAQPGHGLTDPLAAPPEYAQAADELFGFPFSGRASDPYGPGSLFHDMMGGGTGVPELGPLERQTAITSAWDEALRRVPARSVGDDLAFDFNPAAAPGEAFGVADDWAAAFEKPLLARLAEGRAFEEAARAGMYGEAAMQNPLIAALRGQLETLEGLTGRAVADVRDAAAIGWDGMPSGSRRAVAGVRGILTGDLPPQHVTPEGVASLLEHPALAPDLADAKRVAGNVSTEQIRRSIIEDAAALRENAFGDVHGGEWAAGDEQLRHIANSFLREQYTHPRSVPLVKGAVRQYDDVAPLLREIYEYAGQTPPKWAMPKPAPLAELPPAPTGPAPLTAERAAQSLPRGYEPPPLPAGLTEADIPTATQVGLPMDHPDYRFAWLREAQKNAARRRHVYPPGA